MTSILHQNTRPSNKVKVHEIELSVITNSLTPCAPELGINFLNYSVITGTTVTVHRTDTAISYLAYLNDRACHIPVIKHNGTTILQWDDYCSDAYLIQRQRKYNQRSQGVCILFKHDDIQEIVSLGSSKLCLFETFINNVELKNTIINAIRNFVALFTKPTSDLYCSPTLQKTVSENIFLIFKPRESNLPTGLTCFLVGRNGPVRLTRKETQCLNGMLMLKSSKETAASLSLSHKTIEASIAQLKKNWEYKKGTIFLTLHSITTSFNLTALNTFIGVTMLQTRTNQRNDFNPALILGNIAEQAHIDYIDYTQYDSQTIQSYSSSLEHCWDDFLDDDLSCLPALTNEAKNYYRWRDYCSSFLLEQCLRKENLTSLGFTITLKHENFAEHFSLSTAIRN